MRQVRLLPLVFAVVILLGGASVARGQSSQFSGRVTDTSGAVIPGVTVTAIGVATGLQVPVVTNAEGYYTIPGLEPGKYTLKMKSRGSPPPTGRIWCSRSARPPEST